MSFYGSEDFKINDNNVNALIIGSETAREEDIEKEYKRYKKIYDSIKNDRTDFNNLYNEIATKKQNYETKYNKYKESFEEYINNCLNSKDEECKELKNKINVQKTIVQKYGDSEIELDYLDDINKNYDYYNQWKAYYEIYIEQYNNIRSNNKEIEKYECLEKDYYDIKENFNKEIEKDYNNLKEKYGENNKNKIEHVIDAIKQEHNNKMEEIFNKIIKDSNIDINFEVFNKFRNDHMIDIKNYNYHRDNFQQFCNNNEKKCKAYTKKNKRDFGGNLLISKEDYDKEFDNNEQEIQKFEEQYDKLRSNSIDSYKKNMGRIST